MAFRSILVRKNWNTTSSTNERRKNHIIFSIVIGCLSLIILYRSWSSNYNIDSIAFYHDIFENTNTTTNKELPDDDDDDDDDDNNIYEDNEEEENKNDKPILDNNEEEEEKDEVIVQNIHTVISAGCNALQDWQSYAFTYHFWKSGQPGVLSRVISGCNARQERKIRKTFQNEILNIIPNATKIFFLYFTPYYGNVHYNQVPVGEKPKEYYFFNRPYGLKYWMENDLGFIPNQSPIVPEKYKNTVFIILDPDQWIIKPFKTDYTNDTTMEWHGGKWFLGKDEGLIVRKGLPFGQLYAYFSYWYNKVNSKIGSVILAANFTYPDNPTFQNGLLSWKPEDIDRYYTPGTPFIAVASDMYDIMTVYKNVAVPVYFLAKKDHLSELFAWSSASAYLKLRHQLAYNFMLSNPDIGKNYEGWNDNNIRTPDVNNDTYFMEWSNPIYNPTLPLPYTFHFCQRYFLGPYYFFKYYLPNNIRTCEHPMLLEPPSLLRYDNDTGKLVSTNENRSNCGKIAFHYAVGIEWEGNVKKINTLKMKKRQAFSLCQIIYKLNDVLEFWKKNHCYNNTNVNYERIYVFTEKHKELALRKQYIDL